MHINQKEETRKKAEEDFKKLFNAYTMVMKYIFSRKNQTKNQRKQNNRRKKMGLKNRRKKMGQKKKK